MNRTLRVGASKGLGKALSHGEIPLAQGQFHLVIEVTLNGLETWGVAKDLKSA